MLKYMPKIVDKEKKKMSVLLRTILIIIFSFIL